MSFDFRSLRNVLRDEINRQIFLLLNEKGALTSEELVDVLNVTPGMLGYHLRKLNGLVDVVDDKYVLSEKGKQAFQMLDQLPENIGISRRRKISWCLVVVSLFTIAFSACYFFDSHLALILRALTIALCIITVIFYLDVKPMSTPKLLYGYLGMSAGLFLWLFSWAFANAIKLRENLYWQYGSDIGFNIFLITSLIVCCAMCVFVSQWFGKKRQYKWPSFTL
ncbi:MAG: helix-turn-helix domain-containing protein [Candidatus Bathyarchaeota archaeon]|nr:helix-turn-helix domain-containing protein [Candidatus Termiticorpusculum sp.]MCL2868910.1 helix-turn-helix domain-containing protein [Candidatus Termiticorpusculum sp.]